MPSRILSPSGPSAGRRAAGASGTPPTGGDLDGTVARLGGALRRHQGTIRGVQWAVIAVYAVLVIVPAFLPLPDRTAHLWSNLTLAAAFAFWGLWWPLVLVSMVLVGRSWCGLLCPEGALTEIASRRSLGRAVPRWLTWRGWPLTAFVLTTVYGQMVSVYQYPMPALLVLGGSTLAAIAVGLVYGRDKRVWCRYLCPVNGVFELLSKLAPVAFQVDRAAWATSPHPVGGREAFNCAPLVPVRRMRGAGSCHMCGRCTGHRGAVSLALRSPDHEIVRVAGDEPNPWQTALILIGLMGVAAGAFHWTGSGLLVRARSVVATWLVDHGATWPLEGLAPWWLLTNYPAQNDVLTLLDGALLVAYVAAVALAHGAVLGALLLAAAWVATPDADVRRRFHHLVQALIPIAGCGVFLGLSAVTVSMLRSEGVTTPFVGLLRASLLAGAVLWSGWLAWQVAGLTAGGLRRAAATGLVSAACLFAAAGWAALFWLR